METTEAVLELPALAELPKETITRPQIPEHVPEGTRFELTRDGFKIHLRLSKPKDARRYLIYIAIGFIISYASTFTPLAMRLVPLFVILAILWIDKIRYAVNYRGMVIVNEQALIYMDNLKGHPEGVTIRRSTLRSMKMERQTRKIYAGHDTILSYHDIIVIRGERILKIGEGLAPAQILVLNDLIAVHFRHFLNHDDDERGFSTRHGI